MTWSSMSKIAMHTRAECLVFGTFPESLVTTIEACGAVRSRSRDFSYWCYPSCSDHMWKRLFVPTEFYISVMCQRQEDSDRFRMGQTIRSYLMDASGEGIKRWAEELGRAVGGDAAKGGAMITGAVAIVWADLVRETGATPLRDLLLQLLDLPDAVVILGDRAWTSADARGGHLSGFTLGS
jgi:hypothetical protein